MFLSMFGCIDGNSDVDYIHEIMCVSWMYCTSIKLRLVTLNHRTRQSRDTCLIVDKRWLTL